ncbi:hypothetical protein PAPYR_6361 [Paratrimastix pyriformis]|uniref:E3 ubiquitin-protein ligase RNF216 UBA domain-containing protein n=1 Tax=Paratrimastix pyriformis TaxID=342808 RepID=A0ABQ8UKY0_9EUKA|nr:hypothetical protein PAPYR_6361 [Paratrimastix pyriformis]
MGEEKMPKEPPPAVATAPVEVKERDYEKFDDIMSAVYMTNARIHINNLYPLVPIPELTKTLQQHKYHLVPTVNFLAKQLLADGSPAPGCTMHFKRLRNRRHPQLQVMPLDPEFEKELAYIRHNELKQIEAKDLELSKRLLEEEYEKEGALIECGCCFGSFPMEEYILPQCHPSPVSYCHPHPPNIPQCHPHPAAILTPPNTHSAIPTSDTHSPCSHVPQMAQCDDGSYPTHPLLASAPFGAALWRPGSIIDPPPRSHPQVHPALFCLSYLIGRIMAEW